MSDDERPHKSWSDASFEFKGFFAYHVAMMAMMIFGRALPFVDQAFVAGTIAASVAVVSVTRRIQKGWRWSGLTVGRSLSAIVTFFLLGYFTLAMTGFSLERFTTLGPFSLAAVGIAVFGILSALRLVHGSEADFLAECGDRVAVQAVTPAAPRQPRWKSALKWTFAVAFTLVWLEGVTSFYVFDKTFRAGAHEPTGAKTEALINKGTTVYVTPDEKRLVDRLQLIMMLGIPSAIATAFFLQYVVKVNLSTAPD